VSWSTLVLVAAVATAPAQKDDLSLTNVRFTRGVLGPARPDAKVLPGDNLFLSFDIEGITIGDDGKVQYGTGIEVLDPDEKSILRQDPNAKKLETMASLGGNRVPAFAMVDIGLAQPAGKYTLRVNVVDRASGKKASVEQKFEVLPKAFGLVRLSVTNDADGLLPITTPGVGQAVWLHFGVVGFDRDPDTKQPKVQIALRIFDEEGKPTLAKPHTGVVDKNVLESATILPFLQSILLNRPGKFTAELTATDMVSKKTDKASCHFVVFGK
jgi:hypothetical protein